MDQSVQQFYAAGLAPSTKAVYKAGQQKFVKFCTEYNIKDVLPVSQELLCYYVSYLGREGLAFSTIKGYLSALRNLQITYGFASPFDTPMPKLDQILRGIKISRSKQGRLPRRKLPVTPTILRQVRAIWSEALGKDFNQTLLWAVATVCFFGFLRAGEITLKANEQFDTTSHLSFEDVATDDRSNPTFIQLMLKTSKTDPFRNGANITIGATGDEICPVTALFSYLRLRGNAPGPLFRTDKGLPLTRACFVARFREALEKAGLRGTEAQQYSGHSFRAGAASTAAAMGMEDSLIKTLGRWESSAYLIYLRLPREDLQSVSKKLARYGKA